MDVLKDWCRTIGIVGDFKCFQIIQTDPRAVECEPESEDCTDHRLLRVRNVVAEGAGFQPRTDLRILRSLTDALDQRW